jgi:hypothetical protein
LNCYYKGVSLVGSGNYGSYGTMWVFPANVFFSVEETKPEQEGQNGKLVCEVAKFINIRRN